MKRKFYVFMAVLSGLIFALSTFYYLKTVQSDSKQNIELKPLVVASVDIPPRSIVQASQLMIISVPIKGYPQGGASKMEEVTGKVLLVGVKNGDFLLSPMLESPYSVGSGTSEVPPNSFSLAVPEGQRALAIPVSLVGSVGYKVKPGDRVDILVTTEVKEPQGSTTITSLAAQDVLVLNTGNDTLKDSDKTPASGCYIVAVNVSQAMAVTLGSEKGTLRLLLRNPVSKENTIQTPIDTTIYRDGEYFNRFR